MTWTNPKIHTEAWDNFLINPKIKPLKIDSKLKKQDQTGSNRVIKGIK